MTRRLVAALCCAAVAALSGSVPAAATATGAGSGVFPTLRRDLVAHCDFEHPNGASRVRDGLRQSLCMINSYLRGT